MEMGEARYTPDRCPECGIDFNEFPDQKHDPDECSGPECTCYETIGGHQPGCPQGAMRRRPIPRFADETVSGYPPTRCKQCQSVMHHTRLNGWVCPRGCHPSP